MVSSKDSPSNLRYLSKIQEVNRNFQFTVPYAFQFAFHHLGFGKSVSRSNLGKANEIRDVRIFQEFADRMVSIARSKVDGVKDFFLANKVYAFDSSTISLCLSIYWWAKMHHGKGGVKLHTLYDVKTDIPAFVVITDAALQADRGTL